MTLLFKHASGASALAWPHYVAVVCAAVAILAGFVRVIFHDFADPLHCGSLLSRGTWLDRRNSTWQPEGCMIRSYGPNDVLTCLTSRHVVFIGDSVTRQLFYQFSNILDPGLPTSPPDDGKKQQDVVLHTKSSVQISFYWDPYLNSTVTTDYAHPYGERAPEDRSTFRHLRRPAMLVLGSGLWHLRYSEGGLSAWEANIESLFDILQTSAHKAADEVVILPVTQIVPSLLSPERARTMHISDIEAMNSDLFHRVYPSAVDASSPVYSSSAAALPLVFNSVLDPGDTKDGLHYSDAAVRTQANILLNFACNNALPKIFPISATCCSKYPNPGHLHFILLATAILWGPLNWYMTSQGISRHFIINNPMPPLIISGATALIYIADRTGFWLKEHKSFNPYIFTFFMILTTVVGLGTLRRADRDLGFLNREQTSEWKGWMQVIILLYHYFEGSKISGIYNPIRILVASYLFMTGYGHATYYYTKGDFSFLRVAQVLMRLNTLTLLLSYTMNTDYLSYYFAPLVSTWFIVIYGTMVVGARFNQYVIYLLVKIILSATAVSFLLSERVLWWIFHALNLVFKIQWSAKEWAFRTRLDVFIVYAGMLTALAVIKAREHRLTESSRWPMVVKTASGISFIGIVWYFAFELSQESKFTYNKWHPYISFIPILSFIILRNATQALRSIYSKAFVWIGGISLELYIIQYHLWLAGDTKGLLIVVPGARWRPLNFLITTVVLVSVSKLVAQATNDLTMTICGTAGSPSRVSNGGEDVGMVNAEAGYHVEETKAEATHSRSTSSAGGQVTSFGGRLRWRLGRLRRWMMYKTETVIVGTFQWIISPDRRTYGVKARMTTIVVVMWILNLLWT